LKNLKIFHSPEELKKIRINEVTANKVLSSIMLSIKQKQPANKVYTD